MQKPHVRCSLRRPQARISSELPRPRLTKITLQPSKWGPA